MLGTKLIKGARRLGQKIVGSVRAIGKKVIETVREAVAKPRPIPDQAQTFASLASQAYGKRHDTDGWVYDKDLSDAKKAVWFNGNNAAIAFRGTVLSNKADIADDGLIITGKEDTIKRIPAAIKLIGDVAASITGKIYLIGHSLGGTIVMGILRALDRSLSPRVEGFAYNPGVIKIEQDGAYSRLNILRVIGDPISVIARTIKAKTNRTYEPKAGIDPHTIRQFTPT